MHIIVLSVLTADQNINIKIVDTKNKTHFWMIWYDFEEMESQNQKLLFATKLSKCHTF